MATIRLVTIEQLRGYPGLVGLLDPAGDFVVELADNPNRTKDTDCLLVLFHEFYSNLEKHKKNLLKNYPNAVICMISMAEISDKVLGMKSAFEADAGYCKAMMARYCKRAKRLSQYDLAGKVAGDRDMETNIIVISLMSSPSDDPIVRAAHSLALREV